MRNLIFLILIVFCSFSQKTEFDSRLIGRWVNLFIKDSLGQILKNMFSGKNYVETFSKNEKLILDPQFLRDDKKRNGISKPLDFSAIPTLSWKTINNEVLVIETGQGSPEIRYGFSGVSERVYFISLQSKIFNPGNYILIIRIFTGWKECSE